MTHFPFTNICCYTYIVKIYHDTFFLTFYNIFVCVYFIHSRMCRDTGDDDDDSDSNGDMPGDSTDAKTTPASRIMPTESTSGQTTFVEKKEEELEKERLIAELQNKLKQMQEENEELKKKETMYEQTINEKNKEIEDLSVNTIIQVAEAVEKAYKQAAKSPVPAQPLQTIQPPSPVEPPSRILRIKTKTRLRTEKEEYVYEDKTVSKKQIQTKKKTEQPEIVEQIIEDVSDYISKRPPLAPKRLQFSKNARVWNVLDKDIQEHIKLIHKKAPEYVYC